MGRPAITPDEAEIELGRSLEASLGEARVRELAAEISATAEAMAVVLGHPVGLDDVDPDFARPMA